MAAIENIEWLNQNLLRQYPLHEGAAIPPKLSNGGVAEGVSIPTCLLVDFNFTVPFDAASGELPSLTGVIHSGDAFSIEVSIGDSPLTAYTVNIGSHAINSAYPLSGQGEYADCHGWVVFGDLERAARELPEGAYRFDPGQAPFEVSTLRAAPRGVRSITAIGKYGLREYAPLYGNVKLIAGSDVVVRNDSPNNAIWLQAQSGVGYERTAPCDCGAEAHRVVGSINGMTFDDISIVGDGTCVTVTATQDPPVITISDACSTPCCGCSELNFVTSAVDTITQSIATLNAYAAELQQRLAELSVNQLATRTAVNAYPKKMT